MLRYIVRESVGPPSKSRKNGGMLNVNARLRKDVDAMKTLATLPPSTRRAHIRALTPVVISSEELENERLAKTFSGLDQQSMISLHPTVMISSAGLEEQTKASLLSLHETTQEAARQSVLEQRRTYAGKELHGLLQQVFAHYGDEPDELSPTTIVGRRHKKQMQLAQHGKKTAHPTVMVPTIKELMDALTDERMHFETITQQTNDSTRMLENLARQLQWLVAELGTSKERAEVYEQQYKLLLIDYGHQTERLHTVQGQYQTLSRQFADQASALQAERSRSADNAREAARQVEALRESLKEAMEANLALHMGGPAHGRSLPPLRTARGKGNTSALAALMGSSSTPVQSRNVSHTTSPRLLTAGGANGSGGQPALSSPRSPNQTPAISPRAAGAAPAAAPMLNIDEKEKYLTAISGLRKEVDEHRQRAEDASEALVAANAQIVSERERVVIAEKASMMELHATQQLLKTLRDGHVRQLEVLERTLSDAHAKAASQEDHIVVLQNRLKDSSARLLSLQNLLLSGPSVQTLLMSSTTSKVVAEDASETLCDLADRISEFTGQFSTMSAADFAAAKEQMESLLHPESAAVPRKAVGDESVSATAAAAADRSVSPTAGSSADAGIAGGLTVTSLRSRRKPNAAAVAHVDQQVQTDEVQWMTHDTRFVDDGSITTVPGGTAKSRSSNGRSTGGGSSPKLQQSSSRKGSALSASALNEFTEQIAVSVAGGGGGDASDGESPFAPPLDAPLNAHGGAARTTSTASLTPSGSSNALHPPASKSGKSSKPTAKLASSKVPQPKGKPKPAGNNSPSLKRSGSATAIIDADEDDECDDEDDLGEEAQMRAKKAEQEAMRKVASTLKSGGISSTNFELGSSATSEISANLDRMTALRKQIGQSADQIHQLQQSLDREKRGAIDLERRLDEQAKSHSKDGEKIAAQAKQIDAERSKVEKMSERISTLLSDITQCHEKIHDVQEERDQLQDSLMSRIEELERIIVKYKKADERTAMINKERQFLEVCERAIRCLMSAEATSSCNLCLSRLTNPVTIVPCGHTCCEHCFLLHQAERNISLPSDAYDALQTIYGYRQALVEFHEVTERAQADFLAGLIPLPPEVKRPPKPPVGYLTRSTFTKALTGCSFSCPECDKALGTGYCQQFRLEELCSRLSYVSSVVGELQQLGKARYMEEVQLSDPTAELQLENFVIADKSKRTQKQSYVDLEATPPNSSSDEDDG